MELPLSLAQLLSLTPPPLGTSEAAEEAAQDGAQRWRKMDGEFNL